MKECLFCKIANGEIPSKKVYEDGRVYAFYDIDPKAPEHILIIPKKHMDSVMQAQGEEGIYLLDMIAAAQKIAVEKGIDTSGFRLVINTGVDGGQTVSHLHLHLLGGRNLGWPPG